VVEDGGFPQELTYFSDMVLTMAIAARYGMCLIPETLTCVRLSYDSTTSKYSNNSGLWEEGVFKMQHCMKTKYSGVLSSDFIDNLKKQLLLIGFYHSIFKISNSLLKTNKCFRSNKSFPRRIFCHVLRKALSVKNSLLVINYLLKHKLSVIAFIRNHVEYLLFQRRHKHLL
jgi:hypothetical protein